MSDQPPPTQDPKKRPGWIERWAEQSTGLPPKQAQRKSADPGPEQAERSAAWRLAGIGIQFAGTVALFSFFGYWLDGRLGWTPWATVTLAMIAVIGNTYLLIKEAIKMNR